MTAVSADAIEVLISLGVALVAGFVVGAEREQRKQALFGGARTFPLIALAGALGTLLGVWALVVLGVGVALLVSVAYFKDESDDRMGMTGEVAALVTFALGALSTARELPMETQDRLLIVAAGATATLALLSLKQPLHAMIERVSQEDVYATTKLLLLAVIVLPLLPDEDLGPWGALNPRSIGLLVVLISAIGFAGYVAIRVFGARRGLGLTGVLGGLASSTAVTLSFSGRARENPELLRACAVAIVLASSTMYPRMVVEIYAVSPSLGTFAQVPFLGAGAVGLAAGAILYFRVSRESRKESGEAELRLENPFSLNSALKFAALFTAVLIASKALTEYFADAGAYASAAVAGLADVDVITLSLARMADQASISQVTAVDAIGIAALSNTAVKTGIAAVLGGPRLGVIVGSALFASLAAGFALRVVLL